MDPQTAEKYYRQAIEMYYRSTEGMDKPLLEKEVAGVFFNYGEHISYLEYPYWTINHLIFSLSLLGYFLYDTKRYKEALKMLQQSLSLIHKHSLEQKQQAQELFQLIKRQLDE
jgi:tetratricopeptide (TPR) repeat protein